MSHNSGTSGSRPATESWGHLSALRRAVHHLLSRSAELASGGSLAASSGLDSGSDVFLPRHILLLVLASGLCQCSSGPNLSRAVTIGPNEPARVVFHQAKSSKVPKDLTQTLCTDAVVSDRASFYSDPSTDQFTKVLGQNNMQLLLDGLATAGFFKSSRQQVIPGSSAYLRAEVGNQVYILSRNANFPAEERMAFTQSWGVFIEIYNATNAYRSGDDNNEVLRQHEAQQRGLQNIKRLEENRGRQ